MNPSRAPPRHRHRAAMAASASPSTDTSHRRGTAIPAPRLPPHLLPSRSSPTDDFLLIEASHHGHAPVDAFLSHNSALAVNCDLVLRTALKKAYPHLTLTVCNEHLCDIFACVSLGLVTLRPNTRTDHSFLTHLAFNQPLHRADGPGEVQTGLDFGCFDAETKSGKKFVYYCVRYMEDWQLRVGNYFLHEGDSKEVVEALVLSACAWSVELHDEILVFQNDWFKDHQLWQSVQKANWKDVILDDGMKKSVISDFTSFFASKQTYHDLGVPWKRGLIFHGPPGNGKTISIKAMMKTLPYPSLYVKSFHTWAGDEQGIKMIFSKARAMAPCLLILEDIDSLVDMSNRSYFLNEVDGIDENDGILILATTNFLDRLDPGIVSRPSRFDRKYYFPMPSLAERTQYCTYWRSKLAQNKTIDFPEALARRIAAWTEGFSFAYLKEAFVSSLLIIAGRESGGGDGGDGGDGGEGKARESFEEVIKKQIEVLKKEMGDGSEVAAKEVKEVKDVEVRRGWRAGVRI